MNKCKTLLSFEERGRDEVRHSRKYKNRKSP